ncbi:hypothetical protein ES703_50000 [subsurface metagenome]
MLPDKLNFLGEFEKFYQGLVKDIKEGIYGEKDFYIFIGAKIKRMDWRRRNKKVLLNKRNKNRPKR